MEEAHLGGSDKELRDIVLNFIIAGRDTTACALSWTLYELARAPEVQAKLRAEFDTVFADELGARVDGGRPLDLAGLWTLEKVDKLKYAHAVALEVLRLHPSIPKDIKCAVNADTWPDGTAIPAGAAVVYCPYAMGRDARKWEAPLSFRPERFLGDDGGVHEPSAYEYPVFNAGPRLCLGKGLAMMELKLVTASLLHAFDFAVAVPHEGGYLSTVVLPMSPGLMVQLKPRHAPARGAHKRASCNGMSLQLGHCPEALPRTRFPNSWLLACTMSRPDPALSPFCWVIQVAPSPVNSNV